MWQIIELEMSAYLSVVVVVNKLLFKMCELQLRRDTKSNVAISTKLGWLVCVCVTHIPMKQGVGAIFEKLQARKTTPLAKLLLFTIAASFALTNLHRNEQCKPTQN